MKKLKLFSILGLFVMMFVVLFGLNSFNMSADEITHEAEQTIIYKDKSGVLLKDDILELVKDDFTGTALVFEIVNDQYSGNGNKLGEYTITVQAKSGEDTLRKTYKVKVVNNLYFDYYYDNNFYVGANKEVTKEQFVKALKLLEIIPNIDLSMTTESEYFDYTGEVGSYATAYQYISSTGDSGEGEININVLDEAIFDLEIDKSFDLNEFWTEYKPWIIGFTIILALGLGVYFYKKK